VEDELTHLRRLLQKTEEERLFLHIKDNLTPDEKHNLIEKIERLMDDVVYLKGFFDLKPRESVLRWIVKATSVYLSIQLEEVMPERLEGYGEVTQQLKETLDPVLKRMISIFRQMESVVRLYPDRED